MAWIKWPSKTQKLDHSKSDQMAAILESYVLVLFLNSSDYNYSCSYGLNQSYTEPSQI